MEPQRVRLRHGRLTIELRRDRWELYQRCGRLDSVESVLRIYPVASVEWALTHSLLARLVGRRVNDRRIWIGDLVYERERTHPAPRPPVLRILGGGDFWSLAVVLKDARCEVSLEDLPKGEDKKGTAVSKHRDPKRRHP